MMLRAIPTRLLLLAMLAALSAPLVACHADANDPEGQAEELAEVVIRAKSTDIHVPLVGLAWMPYQADETGRLRPAW